MTARPAGADAPRPSSGNAASRGPAPPRATGLAVVVMGVSGSGKSTLGERLAAALGCPFLEGDSFHDAAAVAKMHGGHALTDEDRWPWLDRVGRATARALAEHGDVVVACSALRRAYRERLAAAAGTRLRFVMLDVPREDLERRLAARRGHYMPASLLDSQIETLEPPGADEPALMVNAARGPAAACRAVMAWLEGTPA